MSDTLITVIAILLAAILMFVFPLMTTADKVDKVSQSELETIVNDFVNNVKNKGYISKADYESFTSRLPSQNTYDIEIEVWELDENSQKKALVTNSKKIGENVYVGHFTSDILPQLNNTNSGKYICHEGDIVKVRVRNTNQTTSQQFSLTPNADISVLDASASATVTTNGQ